MKRSGQAIRREIRVPLKVKLSLLITLLIVVSVLLIGDNLLKHAENSLTAEITKRGYTIARDLERQQKQGRSPPANDSVLIGFDGEVLALDFLPIVQPDDAVPFLERCQRGIDRLGRAFALERA